VTLLSLANAYRALANGGIVSAPRLQPGDTAPGTRVMAAAPSFIVADILADNGARVPTFGLDNALATRYWSAVKTGTSKDMRDNWCVGFSARYTVGVWVGNASGAPMHAVSGVTGAAPVWRTVMDALQRSDVAAEHPGASARAGPRDARAGPTSPRGRRADAAADRRRGPADRPSTARWRRRAPSGSSPAPRPRASRRRARPAPRRG
jgi:penicillin-binding protein 1C